MAFIQSTLILCLVVATHLQIVEVFEELKRRNVLRVAAAYIVTAWLIIQVTETILPQFGLEHRVRTVIIVLAIGFFPAMILAWALEWTSEGIKRDAGADAAENGAAAASAGRKFDRIVIAILTLALAWFVYDKLAPPAPDIRYSIAVLPFSNESPDTIPDYLADGMAGEVRDLLGKLPQLLVIERSSSYSFKGQNKGISEIGRQLGVSHLLTGAVTQLGNGIRVQARLVDVAAGKPLWSRDYTGTLSEIFAVQDEIASDVTTGLELKIDGAVAKARRTSPEALTLMLRAKQLWYDKMYLADAEAITALLDEALEIDPNYVPAMVWKIYANNAAQKQGFISAEEENQLWLKLASRILAIEPDNAAVHNMFAWQAMYVDRDLQAAAASYARAVNSDPNDAEILRAVARFALLIGREDDAIAIINRSMTIDPMCSLCLYHASRIYMYAGRFQQAEALRQQFVTLYGSGHYQLGLMKLLQGKAAEALIIFQDLETRMAQAKLQDDGQTRVGLAIALHDLGRHEESDKQLSIYVDKYGEQHPIEVAKIYAWRNERDSAFEWLSKAERNGSAGEAMLVVDPIFRNLRDDQRWTAILESRGMSKPQLAALDFPIELLTQSRGE